MKIFLRLDPGQPNFSDLLAASCVSCYWRTTILSAAHLWSTITSIRNMSPAMFGTYLERSQDALLRIVLSEDDDADLTPYLSYLIPHMHRIQALGLAPIVPSRGLNTLLTCPAPALEALCIWDEECTPYWTFPDNLFSGHAPRLRDFCALPCRLPAQRVPVFSTVVSFGAGVWAPDRYPASTGVDDLRRVFVHFPRLRFLALCPLDGPSRASEAPLAHNLESLRLHCRSLAGTSVEYTLSLLECDRLAWMDLVQPDARGAKRALEGLTIDRLV